MPADKSKKPIKRLRRRRLLTASFLLFILLAYMFACYIIPLPAIGPVVKVLPVNAENITPLVWPKQGQSAIGALGYDVLDAHGGDTPLPIASVAKILTVLAVLKQKPLQKGQSGPIITITAEDFATYQKYANSNGSLVPVQVGEQLSEYQALQAVLLPSANNIADLLVKWAFGSEADYVNFANLFAKSLGLKHTTIADASGFSAKTVSTAHDLVLLGENAMDNPVLAEIVGQDQATIPVAGVINNVNLLVGHQEIVGIKTGNTDEAGGCYLFAAKHSIAPGQELIIIGVVIGETDLNAAINNSLKLLESSFQNFAVIKAISMGQAIGSYTSTWGSVSSVSAAQDIRGVIWKNRPPKIETNLQPWAVGADSADGEVSVIFGRQKLSSQLIIDRKISSPSLKWRLLHPLQVFKIKLAIAK